MTRYFGIHTLEGEWHSLLPRYVLLADRVRGKRVLDIGCGTGIGSSMLMDLGAESVNGVDHRPEVLELARVKHAKQGLNFHVMFWEELEFPDNTFDIVLCLDPTAPVTDANLLRDIKRVMIDGGQYICAIEKRPQQGMESILPRYGYAQRGKELDVAQSGERSPQIGNLNDVFERVFAVTQRPRLSFVFDHDADLPSNRQGRTTGPDESGLWIGDMSTQVGSSEQTDEHSRRWIETDDQLCEGDGDPAAVELLFCGPDGMLAPTPREVTLPYLGLTDRLQELIAELQLRQHPRHHDQPSSPGDNAFHSENVTSEFEPLSQQRSQPSPKSSPPWGQLQEQLDHMTSLYQGVRRDIAEVFERTQQELKQRDRYIEQLVDTMHRWRQNNPPAASTEDDADPVPSPSSSDNAFEAQPTSIFRRHALDDSEESASADESEEVSAASPSDDEEREEMDSAPVKGPPSEDEGSKKANAETASEIEINTDDSDEQEDDKSSTASTEATAE